jgi:DNA-binding MarR family transcriptional regulator
MKIIDLIMQIKLVCNEKEKQMRDELGLSSTEFKCLSILGEEENISCNELAQKLDLSSSRASRVIDILVTRDYLVREDSEQDRRLKTVFLSENGKTVKNDIEKLKQGCEEKMKACIPSDKLDDLKSSLVGIVDTLKKL